MLVADELHHMLQSQILVVRHVDGGDTLGCKVELLPRHDVLQEVDGDVVYTGR